MQYYYMIFKAKESLEALKNEWYPDLLKYGEKYTIKAVVGHEKYLGAFESDCLADEEYAKQFAKEEHLFILFHRIQDVGLMDYLIV